MDVQNLSHPLYYHISSKASCDPCRTIYLCPPAAQAGTLQAAREFALRTGWQDLAEESQSVLVVPVAPEGWTAKPKSLFLDIYRETSWYSILVCSPLQPL